LVLFLATTFDIAHTSCQFSHLRLTLRSHKRSTLTNAQLSFFTEGEKKQNTFGKPL
jgi:hypothetical protein